MKKISLTLSTLTLALVTQAYAMPAIDSRLIEHHEFSSPGVKLVVTTPTNKKAGLTIAKGLKMLGMNNPDPSNYDGISSQLFIPDSDMATVGTPYTATGSTDINIVNFTNQTHTYTIYTAVCTSQGQMGLCSHVRDTIQLTAGDSFDYRKNLSNTLTLSQAGSSINTLITGITRDHLKTVYYGVSEGFVDVAAQ